MQNFHATATTSTTATSTHPLTHPHPSIFCFAADSPCRFACSLSHHTSVTHHTHDSHTLHHNTPHYTTLHAALCVWLDNIDNTTSPQRTLCRLACSLNQYIQTSQHLRRTASVELLLLSTCSDPPSLPSDSGYFQTIETHRHFSSTLCLHRPGKSRIPSISHQQVPSIQKRTHIPDSQLDCLTSDSPPWVPIFSAPTSQPSPFSKERRKKKKIKSRPPVNLHERDYCVSTALVSCLCPPISRRHLAASCCAVRRDKEPQVFPRRFSIIATTDAPFPGNPASKSANMPASLESSRPIMAPSVRHMVPWFPYHTDRRFHSLLSGTVHVQYLSGYCFPSHLL